MAQKQLSIIVKAVDQATGVFGSIVRGLGGIAGAGAKAAGSLVSLANPFTSIAKAAALIGGPAGAFYALASAADDLDKINDASKRTGLAVDTLSELRYMAQLASIDFEQLAGGVATFQKNVSQYTRTGAGKAADVFKDLWIGVRDGVVGVRDINELLPDTIEMINKIQDPSKQVEFTKRLFGDDRFLQFIKEGPENLRRYREEAKRLGVVFTPEQVNAASEFRDAIDRVKQGWLGLRVAVLDKAGPELTRFTNAIAGAVAAVPDIVGNVVRVVRQYGAGDSGVRAAVQDAVLGVGRLIEVSIRATGPLIGAAIVTAAGGALEFAKAGIYQKGALFIADINQWIADRLRSLDFGPGDPTGILTGFVADKFEGIANAVRGVGLAAQGASMANFIANSKAAADEGGNLAQAWAYVRATVPGAAADAAASIDRLLGVTDALAAHAVGAARGVRQIADEAKNVPERVTFWGRAVDGVSEAYARMRTKAEDVFTFAQETTGQLAESFSSGLAGAIITTVENIKDAGQAFRSFFAGLFRQIAQATLQFAIFRTLTSVFGSVGVGGAGDGFGKLGNAFGSGALVRPLHGGVIAAGGALAMLGGGVVPGNQPRDFYPALLASGEGVVNRTGMASLGRAGLRDLNQGRSGGGGNVSFGNINVSVSVQGSGGTLSRSELAKVGEAVTREVIRNLEENVAIRQRMRGGLG